MITPRQDKPVSPPEQQAAISETLQLLSTAPAVVAVTLRPHFPYGSVIISVRKTAHWEAQGGSTHQFWWAVMEEEGGTAYRTAEAAYEAAVQFHCQRAQSQHGPGSGRGHHDEQVLGPAGGTNSCATRGADLG